MTARVSTSREALEEILSAAGGGGLWVPDFDAAEERAAEIGWELRPTLSLPESAPKGDPVAAAERIEDLHDRHWAVWWLLSFAGPLSDEELCERYRGHAPGTQGAAWRPLPAQSAASIRSRRAELVRAGHVEKVEGLRRPTSNGATAAVWRARGESGSTSLKEAG